MRITKNCEEKKQKLSIENYLKNRKREYRRNRYKNMSEDKK